MKKIEKKTGRRASRKRQKMEKLALKVAPGREQSDRLAPSRDSQSARPTDEPLVGVPSQDLQQRVSENANVSRSEFTPSSSSGSGCNGSSLHQVHLDSSRSSIRRRRRMKRIREELKKQDALSAAERLTAISPVRDGEPETNQPSRSTPEAAAADAADVVRKIADSPKSESDPTAQSMVAIAGAVTALASAIQFRLTDPSEAKPKESAPAEQNTADSKQVEQAAVSEPVQATIKETKTKIVAIAAVADHGSDSANESVNSLDADDLEGVSDHEEPAQNESTENFDEPLFDDDESDVAGAYTVLPPSAEPEESYRDWFLRVVVRNKWMTWFTAFYVHWLLVLFMMVIFVHGPEHAANLLLNGAFAETVPEETESFEMSVTEPLPQESEPEEAAASEPAAEPVTVSELAEEAVALNDSLLKEFSSQNSESESDSSTESDSEATPTARTLATPARSVSQGSFSVWTEPEYPNAGEPYRIIVQIQLPPKTKNYHLRDLNGVVVGSDGYRKTIPGSNQKPLQIVDGCVRLVVPIVSADEKVRDTIYIRSKLLKETQKLLLEF